MPPSTPGRKVIVALGDRSVLGTIVRAEPAPRFGSLDRTRLTIRTEPHDVETTALARDVVPDAAAEQFEVRRVAFVSRDGHENILNDDVHRVRNTDCRASTALVDFSFKSITHLYPPI